VSGKYPYQYCGKCFSRKDARKRHENSTEECIKLREKTAGSTAVADEPGPSTTSGNTIMTPISIAAPSGPFTFEAPKPSPNSMQRQAASPATPRPAQQQASQVPPVSVSTQAMLMPFVQPTAQAPRAEPCAVPQLASGGPPLPVIAQDFFTMGPTRQPQQASGVPPPVVAGDINISPDVTEDDKMNDLFESAEMLSPEISTSLALLPAPVVEETTPDVPVAQTTRMLHFHLTLRPWTFHLIIGRTTASNHSMMHSLMRSLMCSLTPTVGWVEGLVSQ
ncbi:hypothetical protein AZE42_11731, partial [Rhizopogon vesiculosus]